MQRVSRRARTRACLGSAVLPPPPVCLTVGIFILYILLWAYEYMRELLNAASPPSGGATRRYHLPPVNARISIVHSGISHAAKLGCLARG